MLFDCDDSDDDDDDTSRPFPIPVHFWIIKMKKKRRRRHLFFYLRESKINFKRKFCGSSVTNEEAENPSQLWIR